MIELLEQRQLLSVQIIDNALVIQGTNLNDEIIVSQAIFGNNVYVSDNGCTSVWNKNCFNKIKVFGGNGDDTIVLTPLVRICSELYGENGQDCILGGSGSDKIWGGNGKDQVNGGLFGDDCIAGNNAPDEIIAGLGCQKLLGGRGPDELFGGLDFSRDTLNGGPAPDVIIDLPNDVIV